MVSIIVPVALIGDPATIPGPSDDGTFKLILNVSFPSTMLSLVTATLTVVLMAPAGIVAVKGVVLKSSPSIIIYFRSFSYVYIDVANQLHLFLKN